MCLMIFCYILRLLPSQIVITDTSSSTWWKQIQTHSQILGWSWGILLKRGRKDCKRQGVKEITRKPKWINLTWAQRSSQRLNKQPKKLYGTDRGPLHRCDSCVARFPCGIPNSREQGCLWFSKAFGTLLLTLNWTEKVKYKVKCLILLKLNMPYFVAIRGRSALFWIEIK